MKKRSLILLVIVISLSIYTINATIYTNAQIRANAQIGLGANQLLRTDLDTIQKVCEIMSSGAEPMPESFAPLRNGDSGGYRSPEDCTKPGLKYWDKATSTFINTGSGCISSTDQRGWAVIVESIECRAKKSRERLPLDNISSSDKKTITRTEVYNYYKNLPIGNPLKKTLGVNNEITLNINSSRKICSQMTGGQYPNIIKLSGISYMGCSGENLYRQNTAGNAWVTVTTNACGYPVSPFEYPRMMEEITGDHIICAALSCLPPTCTSLNKQCGNWSDSCGGTVTCPNCPSGFSCNASGRCEADISSSCPNNQVIMRLNQDKNAHGALWNDINYDYIICYPDIFGENYTGVNDHNCNSNNNVMVWLSNITNAHASITQSSNYNTPVCYGDLFCRTVNNTAGGSCAADENSTLRLYDINNSHLANKSYTNYRLEVCCRHKSALPQTGNLFWKDMSGNKINSANIGDSVYLDYEGAITDYSFNIMENDSGLLNPDDIIRTDIGSILIGNIARGIWKIMQVDWDIGSSDLLVSEGNEEEYYFLNNTLKSADLIVSGHTNTPPVTKIIKPEDESNYIIRLSTNKTELIDFEQQSEDVDDLLKITWNFGDTYDYVCDCSLLGNCATTDKYSNCNTTHQYNRTGTKRVDLYAKEDTRSGIDHDRHQIYVYKDGLNIFAIVDLPDTRKPGWYIINGNRSHVANCTNETDKCNAGAFAVGRTCYDIKDRKNSSLILYCYLLAKSSDPKFSFNWTIDGVLQNDSLPILERYFIEEEDHTIDLKVRFYL